MSEAQVAFGAEWQLCPKCLGTKVQAAPPGTPPGQPFVSTSTGPWLCVICDGVGLIRSLMEDCCVRFLRHSFDCIADNMRGVETDDSVGPGPYKEATAMIAATCREVLDGRPCPWHGGVPEDYLAAMETFGMPSTNPIGQPPETADLQAAFVRVQQLEAERAQANAEATARFIESVPPHLRADPLIAEMCAWVRRYEAQAGGSR